MGFYEFNQNNSGGRFYYSDDLGENVIVEAASADEANSRAESLGIYFDGFGDCPCCGRRWYEKWNDEKPDFETLDEVKARFGPHPEWEVSDELRQFVVHFADGKKEWFNRDYRFGGRRGTENGWE